MGWEQAGGCEGTGYVGESQGNLPLARLTYDERERGREKEMGKVEAKGRFGRCRWSGGGVVGRRRREKTDVQPAPHASVALYILKRQLGFKGRGSAGPVGESKGFLLPPLRLRLSSSQAVRENGVSKGQRGKYGVNFCGTVCDRTMPHELSISKIQ